MDGADCGRGQYVNGFDDTSSGEPRKVSILIYIVSEIAICFSLFEIKLKSWCEIIKTRRLDFQHNVRLFNNK